MSEKGKKLVDLVSVDVNGTSVWQHTMTDMLRIFKGPGDSEQAYRAVKKHFKGENPNALLTAFLSTAMLYKGLSLHDVINYSQNYLIENRNIPDPNNKHGFVTGFEEFVDELYQNQIKVTLFMLLTS